MVSGLVAIEEMEVLESKARFQKPKSISSSALLLLQVDVGLLFGGLICRDKSGCAGNSSISYNQTDPLNLVPRPPLLIIPLIPFLLSSR